MDFNQQSFGSLLFLLENEYLKKEIRNIKKTNKRFIHIKSGINFNNICLKEGHQPTFSNIYIYKRSNWQQTHSNKKSVEQKKHLLDNHKFSRRHQFNFNISIVQLQSTSGFFNQVKFSAYVLVSM